MAARKACLARQPSAVGPLKVPTLLLPSDSTMSLLLVYDHVTFRADFESTHIQSLLLPPCELSSNIYNIWSRDVSMELSSFKK